MYIPKKISEKKVYTNNRLKVLQKEYLEKDNNISNFLVLGNDKKDSIGVFVLPITKDGKIIYTKEYQVGPEKIVYGFPVGSKDDGISLEDTAKKELLEETGYETKNVIFLLETIIEHYVEGKAVYFLATNCEKKSKQNLEIGENIEVLEIDIESFEKMILSGKINSSKSIAMFYLAKEKTNNFTNFNF